MTNAEECLHQKEIIWVKIEDEDVRFQSFSVIFLFFNYLSILFYISYY